MAIYDDPTAALRNLDRHHSGTAGSRVFDSPQRALLATDRRVVSFGHGDSVVVDIGQECIPLVQHAVARHTVVRREGDKCVEVDVECPVECRNGRYSLRTGASCEETSRRQIDCPGSDGASVVLAR